MSRRESKAGTLLAPASIVVIEILPPPVGSIEERERRLIEAVVTLARSLRDERDRLTARLREVELELSLLASRFEVRVDAGSVLDELNGSETVARAARPPRPSRMRS